MRSVIQEVLETLTDALNVPIVVEIPPRRAAEFVLIDPVGGQSTQDALRPEYAFKCYARTYEAAESLVRSVTDAARAAGYVMSADPIPLGRDSTHIWWQVTFIVPAMY